MYVAIMVISDVCPELLTCCSRTSWKNSSSALTNIMSSFGAPLLGMVFFTSLQVLLIIRQ